MTEKDLETLHLFVSKYPTWWYRVGVCDISRDFTAAPQGHSPEAKYIPSSCEFDNGFSCDHEGTVSDAILCVMQDIEEAIRILEND